MTPIEVLRALRDLDVVVTLLPDGEHLHLSAPAGALTTPLRQALRSHKEALLTILEWYEERAAILEYGGGLARADAEREAWMCMEARFSAHVHDQ